MCINSSIRDIPLFLRGNFAIMKKIGGIAMKKTTKQTNQTEKNEPTNRLRQLRKKKGLTQLQMELKTGIDQSELSKMERGER